VEGNVKALVWLNVFVGGWLMFTAWSVPGGIGASALTMNDAAMATVLTALACWTLLSASERPAALWLQMAAGGWLIVAPFVLRYNPWNDVLMGLLAVTVAVLSLPFAALATPE
jgi:hypothetical protein